LLLALVAVLLRPEGIVAAAGIALSLALCGKGFRGWAIAALLTVVAPPLVNLAFTDTATQTTTLAKWLPFNPYYRGSLWEAVLRNWQILYGVLLDGREWAWTFIPEGYRFVAYLTLPAIWIAAERRGARLRAALLCLVALGILIPTTYETFLVNRLRYLWPFSAPWLLGIAAIGELSSLPLARLRPSLAASGLALPALAGFGFARLAPISVADLAQSSAAITSQQVALGRWAAENLPPDALIGVNDTGAISYYSGRRTFDIVGLTTPGEARYWVGGAGSRFEHYEHLPPERRPTHFIVYPEWFGLPELLGDCLTERRVDGATILGGPLMVACRANYESLSSAQTPSTNVTSRRLLDELDVADLDSEAAHDYALLPASAAENVVESLGDRVDGGRSGRTHERFRLRVEPAGLLVVRLSASSRTEVRLALSNRPVAAVPVAPGRFQELAIELPRELRAETATVELSSPVPLTLLHYWSLTRVL
jgi:hypothetical protein